MTRRKFLGTIAAVVIVLGCILFLRGLFGAFVVNATALDDCSDSIPPNGAILSELGSVAMTPIPVAAICTWSMKDGSASETYIVNAAATWSVYGGMGLVVTGIVLLNVRNRRPGDSSTMVGRS